MWVLNNIYHCFVHKQTEFILRSGWNNDELLTDKFSLLTHEKTFQHSTMTDLKDLDDTVIQWNYKIENSKIQSYSHLKKEHT